MSDTASETARLSAALAASEARAAAAEAEPAQAHVAMSASEAMIAHLRLEIVKLRREQYGRSSERRARLIELQLEELETTAAEDAIAADASSAKASMERGVPPRRPARKPFPAHLPRERIVVEAPTTCSGCGSSRIVRMGEDVPETLEVTPRRWKVIQTVREKFTRPRTASGSASRLRRSTRSRAAGLAPRSSRGRPSRNMASASRRTARPSASRVKASISACRRSPTSSAMPRSRWSRSMR